MYDTINTIVGRPIKKKKRETVLADNIVPQLFEQHLLKVLHGYTIFCVD